LANQFQFHDWHPDTLIALAGPDRSRPRRENRRLK
jgi:hypothetical protein